MLILNSPDMYLASADSLIGVLLTLSNADLTSFVSASFWKYFDSLRRLKNRVTVCSPFLGSLKRELVDVLKDLENYQYQASSKFAKTRLYFLHDDVYNIYNMYKHG